MMITAFNSTGLKLTAFFSIVLLCVAGCGRLESRDPPRDIKVTEVGYTQNPGDEIVSVGILLENPNEELTAESVEVTVTLRDNAGAAIGKTQDILPFFPENTELGIAADVYIEEVNGEVGDVDVDVEADRFTEKEVPKIKIDRVRLKQTEHATLVEGKLTNRAEKHLADVRIDAIILDDGGDVKGGGFSFLSALPKDESMEFSIDTFIRIPDAAEARVYIWPTE